MAEVTRVNSKLKFQTGDVPTQADFEDLHDSVLWHDEGVDSMPVFVGSFSGTQWMAASTFQKITLNTIAVDSHSGWDATNNWWTVPSGQGGTYRIEMKYRFADGIPAGTSHGIGADTTQVDNASFFWQSSGELLVNGTQGGYRHGIINQRLIVLTAGQQIRLYGYLDSGSGRNIVNAEMTIDRIR